MSDEDYSQAQEEAAMHWTINDFASLVESRGVGVVLSALPKNVEELLYWHYFRQIGLAKSIVEDDY